MDIREHIQIHIQKYGYGIAKERYGIKTLLEEGLASKLDTVIELAKRGCIISNDEAGKEVIQKIDDPQTFAEENDLDFVPPNLVSDFQANKIAYELGIAQAVKSQVEQGVCPNCGSDALDYGAMELGICGDTIYYPYECEKCGTSGNEHYSLNFIDHEIKE